MPRHRGRIVNLFLKKSLSCIRYRLATGLPLAWQLAMATYISAPILCVREPGNHHFPFRRRRPWPVQRDLYSQTRRCWWCWSSGARTPGQASARHALFLLFSRLAFGLLAGRAQLGPVLRRQPARRSASAAWCLQPDDSTTITLPSVRVATSIFLPSEWTYVSRATREMHATFAEWACRFPSPGGWVIFTGITKRVVGAAIFLHKGG